MALTAEPILYTRAGCADSARVRTWLTERGVTFVERDAGADLAASRALLATGLFGTPLLVIGQNRVLGFRPRELAAALDAAEGA